MALWLLAIIVQRALATKIPTTAASCYLQTNRALFRGSDGECVDAQRLPKTVVGTHTTVEATNLKELPFTLDVKLWNEGLLSPKYELPSENRSCPQQPFPKIIHFIWFGPTTPQHVQDRILQVARINPTWDVMFWTDQNNNETHANLLTVQNVKVMFTPAHWDRFRNTDQINEEPNPGGKSDWLRLEVVHAHGGIYLDTDAIAVYPLDDYNTFFQRPFVVFDSISYHNLCNCAFGAEKDSKFLAFAREAMREAHLQYRQKVVGEHSCAVFTSAFVRYNQSAMQMIDTGILLHEGPKAVMWQKFEASWTNLEHGFNQFMKSEAGSPPH